MTAVIKINYQALNVALNKNPDNLANLGIMLKPVVSKGDWSLVGAKDKPLDINNELKLGYHLKETLGLGLRTRLARAGGNIGGGSEKEINALVLASAANVNELRRIRFAGEEMAYPRNMTSFLESIAMDRDTLLAMERGYIPVAVAANGQSMVVILDIAAIVQCLKSYGWDKLNNAYTTFFYVYDSHEVPSSKNQIPRNILGELGRNSRKIHKTPGLCQCWLHTAAALVTLMKNP
ncbi:MAG: hypothetical protein LBU15_02200 [Rickettsiales bacterium]|jgi:hypothetical protein|nr:hypothetical protein [Rickettsiales bacterium]